MTAEKNLSISAAIKAGQLLRELNTQPMEVLSSKGKDIKLKADIESERVIIDALRTSGIPIISEEQGGDGTLDANSMRWIVDPLDGTLNYHRKLKYCCVSIALWEGYTPVLGIIYDFNNDDIYVGEVGKGATLNDIEIHTSNIRKKSDSVICTGFPVYSKFDSSNLTSFIKDIQEYKKVRLLGSAAMSLALVASGSVESYRESNIALWDVAAGVAIVEAAGGVSNISPGRDTFYKDVNVTNGSLLSEGY